MWALTSLCPHDEVIEPTIHGERLAPIFLSKIAPLHFVVKVKNFKLRSLWAEVNVRVIYDKRHIKTCLETSQIHFIKLFCWRACRYKKSHREFCLQLLNTIYSSNESCYPGNDNSHTGMTCQDPFSKDLRAEFFNSWGWVSGFSPQHIGNCMR